MPSVTMSLLFQRMLCRVQLNRSRRKEVAYGLPQNHDRFHHRLFEHDHCRVCCTDPPLPMSGVQTPARRHRRPRHSAGPGKAISRASAAGICRLLGAPTSLFRSAGIRPTRSSGGTGPRVRAPSPPEGLASSSTTNQDHSRPPSLRRHTLRSDEGPCDRKADHDDPGKAGIGPQLLQPWR